MPFNLGVQYLFGSAKSHPYLGADVILIPGYVKDVKGTAGGFRARTGLDYMFADSVGWNVNLGVGYIGGKNFTQVGDGFTKGALSPELNTGLVVTF
jgi:hypothetical protein